MMSQDKKKTHTSFLEEAFYVRGKDSLVEDPCSTDCRELTQSLKQYYSGFTEFICCGCSSGASAGAGGAAVVVGACWPAPLSLLNVMFL